MWSFPPPIGESHHDLKDSEGKGAFLQTGSFVSRELDRVRRDKARQPNHTGVMRRRAGTGVGIVDVVVDVDVDVDVVAAAAVIVVAAAAAVVPVVVESCCCSCCWGGGVGWSLLALRHDLVLLCGTLSACGRLAGFM